jgi:hypothetical protein
LDCAFCDSIDLHFRRKDDVGSFYILKTSFAPKGFSLEFATHHVNWQSLAFEEYPLESETWYKVRVEAEGDDIRIYVNDKPLLATTDTQFTNGRFVLGAFPGVHVQFDDIKVTSLGDG